jgi:antitoxin (DNA-binding transcriptional repressor) of toxin-antitoxin stability system
MENMDTIAIGELKANFSTILGRVKKGEKIVIGFGKKKEKVAVLMPYVQVKLQKGRKLGLLKGKSNYAIKGDFQIRDEELLSL